MKTNIQPKERYNIKKKTNCISIKIVTKVDEDKNLNTISQKWEKWQKSEISLEIHIKNLKKWKKILHQNPLTYRIDLDLRN